MNQVRKGHSIAMMQLENHAISNTLNHLLLLKGMEQGRPGCFSRSSQILPIVGSWHMLPRSRYRTSTSSVYGYTAARLTPHY